MNQEMLRLRYYVCLGQNRYHDESRNVALALLRMFALACTNEVLVDELLYALRKLQMAL